MLFSQILAWATAFLCLMEILRFAARVSKSKTLNRFFHRLHIPFGVMAILTGGAHGVLAGNFPDADLTDLEWAPVLFTVNWGTAVYVCILLLGGTDLLRRALKKKWMTLHRALTILFIACLAFHLLEVGISLPGKLFPEAPAKASAAAAPSPAAEPTLRPVVTPTPKPTASPAVEGPSLESGPPVPEDTPRPTPEPTPTPVPVSFSGAVLADGVYEGSADGRNGSISVSVTVEGGAVTDLAVTTHSETAKYYVRAENVIGAILSGQSLEVDAVTGATLSSEGIKAAAYNALLPAVVSGELEID